jgi:hypothetical protein
MYLVQILLPLYDNEKQRFPHSDFDAVRNELTQEFGGVTAFVRSPGEGFWKEGEDRITRDDVQMFEVLTEALSRKWWKRYRKLLEQRFRQDEIVVLASKVKKL